MKLGLTELVKALKSLEKKVKCLRCEVDEIEVGGSTVFTQDSESVSFTGDGTEDNPLIATAIGGGGGDTPGLDEVLAVNPIAPGPMFIGDISQGINGAGILETNFQINSIPTIEDPVSHGIYIYPDELRFTNSQSLVGGNTVRIWLPDPVEVHDEININLPLKNGTFAIVEGGVTLDRPAVPTIYQSYFDSNLNKPIWYNGTDWVDATGTIV